MAPIWSPFDEADLAKSFEGAAPDLFALALQTSQLRERRRKLAAGKSPLVNTVRAKPIGRSRPIDENTRPISIVPVRSMFCCDKQPNITTPG